MYFIIRDFGICSVDCIDLAKPVWLSGTASHSYACDMRRSSVRFREWALFLQFWRHASTIEEAVSTYPNEFDANRLFAHRAAMANTRQWKARNRTSYRRTSIISTSLVCLCILHRYSAIRLPVSTLSRSGLTCGPIFRQALCSQCSSRIRTSRLFHPPMSAHSPH